MIIKVLFWTKLPNQIEYRECTCNKEDLKDIIEICPENRFMVQVNLTLRDIFSHINPEFANVRSGLAKSVSARAGIGGHIE